MNAHVRSLSWEFKKAPLGRVEAAEDLAGKTEELWTDSPGAGGQWEGADRGEALRPCRWKRGSQGRAPLGRQEGTLPSSPAIGSAPSGASHTPHWPCLWSGTFKAAWASGDLQWGDYSWSVQELKVKMTEPELIN